MVVHSIGAVDVGHQQATGPPNIPDGSRTNAGQARGMVSTATYRTGNFYCVHLFLLIFFDTYFMVCNSEHVAETLADTIGLGFSDGFCHDPGGIVSSYG